MHIEKNVCDAKTMEHVAKNLRWVQKGRDIVRMRRFELVLDQEHGKRGYIPTANFMKSK